MMDNQGDLTNLESKSVGMAQASKTFVKQSTDLERIMYWR